MLWMKKRQIGKRKKGSNKSFKSDNAQVKSVCSSERPNRWLGTQEKGIDEYRSEKTVQKMQKELKRWEIWNKT